MIFFFNDTATTEIYTLSLHDRSSDLIHYMTDKYNYEAVQMPFLPSHQRANMGFGICGFANTVDTLSAIKYATVKPIRRSEEHTSELQSRQYLVCRLLLEKKKIIKIHN